MLQEVGSPGPARRAHERLARLVRPKRLNPSLSADHVALISALETVADSISSARTLPEILAAIATEAKRFTGTEKVAICLISDEHGKAEIDRSTLVVRGSRGEHSEEWWGPRLPEIATSAFSSEEPYFKAEWEYGAWIFAVPARLGGEPLGVLVAINSIEHRLREEDASFLSLVAGISAMSIANAKLTEGNEYSLLASERERIAREMHDGIAQELFSISLGLEVCRRQVRRDPDAVAQRLDELQELLRGSMSELRRYIYDLRPAKLQELGLRRAIEYWLRELAPPGDVRARAWETGTVRPLMPEVESCLYWVAREAVTNAVKHSGASEIGVRIEYREEEVRLVVQDNGRGFDVRQVLQTETPGKQMGLRSLEERVRTIDGDLAILSRSGEGCAVIVTVTG